MKYISLFSGIESATVAWQTLGWEPVALLNERLYAKPEDDIKDGLYVSLFQLYLDGFMLSRTGRKRNKDADA